MKVSFTEGGLPRKGAVAVFVTARRGLTKSALALDEATGGAVARAVGSGRFSGKNGETVWVYGPAGLDEVNILLVGLGKVKDITASRWRKLGATIVGAANAQGAKAITVMLDPPPAPAGQGGDQAAALAFGARLASYRFDRYLTREKTDKKPTLTRLTVQGEARGDATSAYGGLSPVADAMDFARDLISEPGNVIHPESLARACLGLRKMKLGVEVLDEAKMQKLGMGALLGVGQGSIRESRLAIMQWQGGPEDQAPVALVGKGVTFDSGGISIKPSGGMQDMKWDMAGAGAVIGLMHALAGRKAPVNAVGVVGLVENMPSGSAQRPGDIVTTMSGQTVEVLNTDAEGRLVLADAMWYTQDRFKPSVMIDLATLTGAIMVALGQEYAGMFASDDTLADNLAAAGKAVGEPVWRMPLAEVYDKALESPAADMANIGPGRWAGSITAAQFLQRFTNDVPWAHLDIAGVAWAEKAKPPLPKGATAFGIQLLDRYIRDHHEVKRPERRGRK